METILALSLVTNIGANAAVKAAFLAARNTDTAMARLGSGTRIGAARDDAMLPVGQASLLEPLQGVAVPISAALVHTVMAVCHVDEDEGEEAPAASSTTSPHQHLLNRAAAGFVVVTNVSMDAQTLTLLAPCSGGLPSCHLLMGKLEWMESSYT